jgi:high-affinity iron transporter
MVAAALLAFREGLEAALILGIVLSVLGRVGRQDRALGVWLGAAIAALISIGVGITLHRLGVAMLLAATVLTWMIFWMARQGRDLHACLERDVRKAARIGGTWALFSLAFLAVLREGIELALFLTAAAFTATAGATLVGGIIGLSAAAAVGWLLFATTARLNVRAFFRVTSALLILVAAELVAHGVHEFNEAGIVPSVVEHVWDTNPVLDEGSGTGQILKAMIGYNGNPSLTEVIAYIGYWLALLLLLWRSRVRAERKLVWVNAG